MPKISLEIARGLAALWVFIYHVRLGLEPGLFRRPADAGYLGVPAFFVISGYCMMASSRGTIARQQPATYFLRRRLRRIFPPFWASILVAIAVPFIAATIVWSRGGAFRWPAPHWFQYSPSDWLTLITLTRGLLATGPTHTPWAAVNAVYWSLAIEVQFYLVMAVALRFRRMFDTALLAVTSLCVAFWLFGPVQPGLFLQYWPMFAMGLGLHTALDKGFGPPRLFGKRTAWMSGVTAGALAAGALTLTLAIPNEGLGRQMLFALACTSVLWASGGFEACIPSRALAPRALAELGKMSYSVYLLHIHLSSLVSIALWRMMPRAGGFSPLLYVGGALPLAYAFYLVCEKRFAAASHQRLTQRNPRSSSHGYIRAFASHFARGGATASESPDVNS